MWLTRFSSPLLALAIVAPLGAQDVPASVEVTAPRNWVLSGRTLQLSARVLSGLGGTITGATVLWRSVNPRVAAVNDSGMVIGMVPGMTEVEASSGNARGRYTVWVHPARIEIQQRQDLEIGQQLPFVARALDADNRTITGVSFSWWSSLPGVASVDASGMVRGLAAGSATVIARLNEFPGSVGYSGQAIVLVRRRPDFRVSPLASSTNEASPVTLKNISAFSRSGDRIAFIAALSSGGQSVMVYENGQLRTLYSTGDFLDAIGQEVSFMNGVAVNARGDVLVTHNLIGFPNQGILFSPAGKPLSSSEFVTQPNGYCCTQITPQSLDAEGRFVFGAYDFSARSRDDLFVRHPDGRIEKLNTETLPGFGAPQWMRNQMGMFGSGKVLFGAGRTNAQGYFLWDGRQITKIVAQGDFVLGNRVDWMDTPIASATGEIYFRLGGPQFNAIFRWSAGTWTKIVQSEQFGTVKVQGPNRLLDVRGQEIVFEANTDMGQGLFRLSGTTMQTITWLPGSPSPGPWQIVQDAFLSSSGQVVITGSPSDTILRSVQTGSAGASTLFEAGLTVKSRAPYVYQIRNLTRGGDGTSRLLTAPSGAILRIASNGITPLLSPGDSLPGGGFVQWVGPQSSSSNGNTVFSVGTPRGQRLYLWRGGQLNLIAGEGSPIRDPLGNPIDRFYGRDAVNNRGQIASFCRYGNQDALLLFPEGGGQPRIVIAPNAIFSWPDIVALDENGRVAFASGFEPFPHSVYLWDNGQTRKILDTTQPGPDNRLLRNHQYLQAAGDKFYLLLQYEGLDQFSEFDGTRWIKRMAQGDRLGFGATIQWFHNGGNFKVSSAGDILFTPGLVEGGVSAVLRRRDGVDRLVTRSGSRSASGNWLGDVQDVTLSDQGIAYFTALDLNEQRIVFYQAVPQ